MEFGFGEVISGLSVDGRELRSAVFNENEVRAAAGLTMVVGAVAFVYAYFDKEYLPLQIVTSLLLRRVPGPGDGRAQVQPGRPGARAG